MADDRRLDFAVAILEAIPLFVGAYTEISGLVDSITASTKRMQVEDRDPTNAEWDALNGLVAKLRARLQAPD